MSVLIKGMKMPELYETYKINIAKTKDGKIVLGMSRLNETGYKPIGEVVEIPEHHGDLIDRDALKNAVLKWMPSDPCGVEEKERPFETDICVSMMQEIEEQAAVIEAEGAEKC